MTSRNLPRISSPLHETAAQLGTILSVWAHPDDETYLAAGIMAAARDNGQRVVCVSATAGEHGTSDPATWPPDRLGRVRRWEAAAAMAVLGVTDHRFLGYEDGSLRADDAGGIARIEDLLDEVRPDTVLTFGADGMTFHPDHIAIHHWVTAAWRRCGHPGRLLYAAVTVDFQARFGDQFEEWDMYMSDERPTGVPVHELAAYTHLSGIALDRKLAALGAMSSQTRGLLEMLGVETYSAQIAEEAFVAARREALAAAPPSGLTVAVQ